MVNELLGRVLCKLGLHDYDEQRHGIASSNVTEITKTCKRCGDVKETYQPN